MKYLTTFVAATVIGTAASGQGVEQGDKNAPQFTPAWPTQTRAPTLASGIELEIEVVADGLETPWGVEVLPGGGYLVTERSGALRLVMDGQVGAPITGVPQVLAERQGGLLDVALSEDFATSRVIFLTYAKPLENGMSATAAARAVLSVDGTALNDVRDVFVQSPPSPNAMHYGARVVPQGDYLFITTGEHFSTREREFAQDTDKTYGKVVRVTLEGGAAANNPFGTEVWSLGHRNVQGADIRPDDGTLWTLEHGAAGGDELNKIAAGENYGWPVVSYGVNYNGSAIGSGAARHEGFTEPQYYWDPVIAPGGFAFYEGTMFEGWQGDVLAASLNPGGLVRLVMEGDRVVGEERFLDGEIRLRDVEIDRDGAILVLDNSDGRLLRLMPK
ncbi:PQQ-dependent sugar dehydrogenase [Sulfitobacter guttiformis]|uniref:Glucose/arabinose dehydrogenase n=1 Tax=Sulfitobacter guttiformis TaxID=74349 RepID=A0A420DJW5_9RHOB|nr:PQQ-dependent sugar dehydrogenase [Sulfitobacter guttiformis]KIN71645.1 Glucose sorbosone dehydrogenase [Sulfitobacter guttiformis KCTC 32187]RKE94524.1 glucose/arabinose dehydrogenase [Sulfitobacter guttiformis]